MCLEMYADIFGKPKKPSTKRKKRHLLMDT